MDKSLKKILINGAILVIVTTLGVILYRSSAPGEITDGPTSQNEVVISKLLAGKYTNPRLGFTIHPPMGWDIDESGELGTFAVFVPADPGQEDALTSISVITEPANYLEDYVRETRERLPEILESFNQIENQRVILGKAEGHLIGGTFLFNDIPLRTLRLIISYEGRGYNVTATALQTIWSKHKEKFEESLLTFRLE
jgi:hypothetical protein